MKVLDSITWYARRLQAMKPAEIRHRLVERWRQLTQAEFLKRTASFDPGPVADKMPRLPEKADAPMELRAQLADDARRLQSGKWQLFGWREVEVGSPPCWHRDAFCGVVIDPGKSAHRLNHRHLPDGADARTIWEINRWAEMSRLAMHGWLNDDLSAIRSAQLWLEDWCERNPPGKGINWTSPLEVALRLINFTWFDALVRARGCEPGGDGLLQSQATLVRQIVPVHAAWVWRYRSAGSSANNHLLGELSALVVAVSRWPKLAGVACGAEEAWELLGREVLNQFAPDGGSREQALHYHLFAFELAWQAVRMVGCKAGKVYDRLIAAADCFQALAHGGEPWDFGDNDDAQVLPMTQDRSRAVKEWRDWMRGGPGALQFWLGRSPWAGDDPAQRVFVESGMAVMERAEWKARLDASPLGFGSLAAHGHGDALHLSVWAGEEALLIDPGTGGYYGHAELRTELAAWAAHNGPQPLGGFQTPKRMGAFLWKQHHAAPVLVPMHDALAATLTHEGYEFRRIVNIQDDAVVVQDKEAGKKAFIVRLVFSPRCQVKPVLADGSGSYTVSRGHRSWELRVTEGQLTEPATECRVSPAYGSIETAQVLSLLSKEGALTFSIQRRR